MRIYLIIFFFAAALYSCGSKESKNSESEKESTEIYNPNGDSELALLMRECFDQSAEIKKKLENGTLEIPDTYVENLKKFHTATATDPSVKVDEFFAFTDLLYNKVEQLKTADLDKQKDYYNQVVSSCISCHESFCPGPITKIKKLRIK